MANQQHPPAEPFIIALFRRYPVTTAIVAIIVFMVWTFPIGFAQAWPAFVKDKTIPEWLEERRWPGMTAQLYGWLTILFFLILVGLLVAIIIVSRRRSIPAQSATAAEQIPAAEVEKLEGRIRELEQEKVALERGRNEDAVFIRQYKSSIEGLSKENAGLESRWKAHVFQYNWIFAKVEAQRGSLIRYVEVERTYFCHQELQTPMLKSVFGIDFRNKSIFDVSVEDKIGGYIEFIGTELAEPPRLIYNPGAVGTGGRGTLTIEQRLTRAEADYIISQGANPADFSLEKLIVTIKSEHVAQDKSQILTIPKRLSSEPQAEIASLKSELEAAKNAKPSGWLQERAKEQAESIYRFASILRTLRYGKHELLRDDPYVEFSFTCESRTVYDLSLDDLKGSISFSRRELRESKQWIERPLLTHGDVRVYRFRQNLTKDDAIHILNGFGDEARFNFNGLEIAINGDLDFKDIVVPRLLHVHDLSLTNEELLKEYPKLRIEIQQAQLKGRWNDVATLGDAWADNAEVIGSVINIKVRFVNPRQTPVIIQRFKLDTGPHITRITPAESGEIYELPHFKGDMAGTRLDNLNVERPIQAERGQPFDGWLQFILLGVQPENLSGVTPTLVIEDSSGEKHTAECPALERR